MKRYLYSLISFILIISLTVCMISCNDNDDKGDENDGEQSIFDCESGVHDYTVENICAICNRALWYTSGLEYSYDSSDDVYSVSGIGSATDTDIVIPYGYEGKPVTAIDNSAFYSKPIESIYIPASITHISADSIAECELLGEIKVDPNNPKYKSLDGNLYRYDSKTNELILWNYALDRDATEFTIPDGVTSIGNYAFSRCRLFDITVPDSVTHIGYNSFASCYNLKSITLGNGIKTIDKRAFERSTRLETVTVGSSLTSIGDFAFFYCVKLTKINYTGTEEQWNKVTKGTSWNNTRGSENISIVFNYTSDQ